MIRLLISVKNTQEALDAMEAGADYIDLKDPTHGALGSLDNGISHDVIRHINKQAWVSATVGDTHADQHALLTLIEDKWELGVDIVKLPLSLFFHDKNFLALLGTMIKSRKMKLIAVMFAEEPVDLTWLPILAETGFYGVMLDTANKGHHLLSVLDMSVIGEFVKQCELHHLQAGLAGALRVELLDGLSALRPSYVGFRSGVCEDNVRENKLLPHLVKQIKDTLYKHNTFNNKIAH
jgi:dihydroneopterin aldolase